MEKCARSNAAYSALTKDRHLSGGGPSAQRPSLLIKCDARSQQIELLGSESQGSDRNQRRAYPVNQSKVALLESGARPRSRSPRTEESASCGEGANERIPFRSSSQAKI